METFNDLGGIFQRKRDFSKKINPFLPIGSAHPHRYLKNCFLREDLY